MQQRFLSMTGFVLAGGASRRMGQPKEKLVLGTETMLARQIRLLRSLCRSVAVLGPPANLVGLVIPAYADELPGHGPLGGIYTGLLRTRAEYNLFLSCDLPFMEKRFLHFLCRWALDRKADATLPESRAHGFQPLCAVYRRRALDAVRTCLALGENKVSCIFPRLRCDIIRWREIARAGFPPRIFDNMNTPADYEAAKKAIPG